MLYFTLCSRTVCSIVCKFVQHLEDLRHEIGSNYTVFLVLITQSSWHSGHKVLNASVLKV